MGKYNISDGGIKEAAYRAQMSRAKTAELKGRITSLLIKRKKYLDKDYSARRLADGLGTNTRYVSAAVSVCFGMNYTSLVNKYRVERAKVVLTDRKHEGLKMEDVGLMAGFANRQSFYAAFYKFTGMTPRQYKKQAAQADEPKCK